MKDSNYPMEKHKDQSFAVVFAAPTGSSKTPIAIYLSYTFDLPVFSTDAIRSEVTEDYFKYDTKLFEEIRNKRFKEIINLGNSFILDASIDREWKFYKEHLDKAGFRIFMISIDLEKDFLLKLYSAKLYKQSVNYIDKWISDHENFTKENGKGVNIRITEKDFPDRLKICKKGLEKWLELEKLNQ